MDSSVIGSSIAIHLFPNVYLHRDKQELNAIPSEASTTRLLHPTNPPQQPFQKTSRHLEGQVGIVERKNHAAQLCPHDCSFWLGEVHCLFLIHFGEETMCDFYFLVEFLTKSGSPLSSKR
jgi:hypothetical protein